MTQAYLNPRTSLAATLALVCVAAWAAGCGGDAHIGEDGNSDGDTVESTGGTHATGGSNDTGTGATSSTGTGGTSNGNDDTTQSDGGTSPSGGSGGAESCPSCLPPPSPECVGTGACGCGPYECPDSVCATADDCEWCKYPNAPTSPKECKCPSCPATASTKAECNANRAAFEKHCGHIKCTFPTCDDLGKVYCNADNTCVGE